MLSLYRFAQIMGLHPLHFMQVYISQTDNCAHPIYQYPWQAADAVSRNEIRQIIDDAEREIAEYLGYWPMPRWNADQLVQIDQPYRVDTWASHGYTPRGDLLTLFIPRGGYYISGGRVAKSVIDADAAVVYSDTDGDNYFETATIGPIATSVTDEEEIALYYPNESGDDDWQIDPIRVTIAAGNVTIVCRREQLVKKNLLEALSPSNVDGTDNNNFLTTVDVYRKYNDPSVQAHLTWRSPGTCSCGLCGLSVQTGCLTAKDAKLGIVTVSAGDWNTDSESFTHPSTSYCRRADYARVWYRSGYRDMNLSTPNITMAREMELAVARLAISKLDRVICSCKTVADIQAAWNTDLRRSVGTRDKTQSLKVTHYEMENSPFGTTIGGITVWRQLRRLTLGIS